MPGAFFFCLHSKNIFSYLLSPITVSWSKGGKVSQRTFEINCLPMCGLDWAWNWQQICPLSPRTCSPQVSNLKWSWLLLEVPATFAHACNWKSCQSSPKLKATSSTGWINKWWWCCFSVAVSCLTLCDPMDCSTPGSSVLHHLPEFAQTSIHWVSDVIQSPHPLSPPNPRSSCPQSFPASGSFPVSQLFTSGGQRSAASASVLPMDIHGWFPFELTGLLSWQSRGLSRVLTSSTVPGSGIFFSSEKNWAVRLGKTEES